MREILRKLAGRLEIKNADERRQVKSRQAVLQGEDFKALWERIKYKTTYRVQFDNDALARGVYRGDQGPELRHHEDSRKMAQGRSRDRALRGRREGDRYLCPSDAR